MSTSVEAAFAHQADKVMDQAAMYEVIQRRLALEAAAQTAGNTAMAVSAELVPTQPQ
jgi:flavin-binding protein dodecin